MPAHDGTAWRALLQSQNHVSGRLLNAPNWLTSVREGDAIRKQFSHLTDWMMTVDAKAYGGFTVNQMRTKMGSAARKQHDEAWGLDFGDPATVRAEIERAQQPPPKRGLLAGLFGRQAPAPKAEPPESGFWIIRCASTCRTASRNI